VEASGRVTLDLVGFGEAMVLVAPSAGSLAMSATADLHVAGAELNVCAATASLGLRAAFATRVGADPLGDRVRADAHRLGVETELVATDASYPTGVFFKDVQPDGERRVYYYRAGSAAAHLDVADADRVLGARPRLVVVSGITMALGAGPRAAVRHLVGGGPAIALDPNLRPALGDVATQAAALRDLLPSVDVLLLGVDEAVHLFGTTDPTEVFAAATAAGVGLTVLKAGPAGCYIEAATGIVHLPTAATSIVDPVGAGDAFAGGFLTGYLTGRGPLACAQLGTAMAARVVETTGDTDGLPDAAEAADLLAQSAATGRP
jgi:2-dehydro-3-deoxygluconokinase